MKHLGKFVSFRPGYFRGVWSVFLWCSVLFISCAALPVSGASYSRGPWQLEVDEKSGALLELRWNGVEISRNPSGTLPFNWGPRWQANSPDFASRLLAREWDEKSGVLVLRTRQNSWEVDYRISLGMNDDPDLFAAGVRLVFSPEEGGDEPEKFDRVVFTLPVPEAARYLLPGKREFASYDGRGRVADLKNGEERRSAWGIPPLLIEHDPSLTLIFMPEYRNDISGSSFRKNRDGGITVSWESRAAGWAYPGEAQEIGPFYLKMFSGNLEQAFEEGVWRMYDSIDLKAVSDTPEWFRDAVVYSFHGGGTIGSGWKDLGGFVPARQELLPRIGQLGFNLIWLLPLEDGHVYWPRDYYKVREDLGNADDLKAFVAAVHDRNMRILFDCVPHGGTPANGALRGNKPWELIFDEQGNAYSYWCFDFGNPDYQKYIAGVVDHNMKTYDFDGCRIDAIIGNHYVNWRKKDFPSLEKVPAYVPEEWYRASLEQNGGKMPPLPYARGSLGCRQGGLEMLAAIRQAVKQNKPDGAVLGEVDHAPYMLGADAIFNFPMASTLSESATKMATSAWIAGLARWLDELNFSYPRGSRHLQYFGSHDHLSPFGWVGLNEVKALMAISMFLEGIPMVYHDQDVGLGIYLKKLIAVRQSLPEFRRGFGRYSTVGNGIFVSVRSYGNLRGIALVNCSPDAAEAELAEPLSIAAPGDGRFALWRPGAAEPVAVGTVEELRKLKIPLRAWGYEVLALRPEKAASPFAEVASADGAKARAAGEAAAAGKETGRVTVSEEENRIDVKASTYSFSLDRSTGRIVRFADAAGKELFHGAGFLLDTDFALTAPPEVPAGAEVKVLKAEEDGSEVTLSVRIPLARKGDAAGETAAAEFLFHCTPDAVKLDAVLEGPLPSERTGFAFAGSEITRWQVSTAEGLLDDFFTVRHLSGTPNQTMPEGILYYRLTGTPVMWQSETNPLNFENPSILAFSGENGIEFTLCDPLDGELRNAMVLDKLAGKPGWHAAFFWNDVQPYSSDAVFPESSDQGKRKFSLVLKTIDTPPAEAETTAWTQLDGLRFRNVSRGWVVENDHYSVELLRCGGVMASLRSRGSDQELLRGNRVYTDRGFRRKWGPKNMNASSAHDGETGVRIYYEDGKLHMRFVYSMREPGRRWLPEPMLWGETEYVFDRSESFQVRWNLVSVGRPHDTPAFLGWELASDNWMSSVFRLDGREIASGLGVKITPAQGTAAEWPDEVEFLNRDGGMMLKLSEIHYPGDAPAQSVTLQDSVFTIACLDGTADDIEPGKRYETSLKVSVGK